MQLLPQDCQTILQCVACQKFSTKIEWNRWQLQKNKNLVCKTCIADGYTTKDPNTYTCRTCGEKKGCKHFDLDQLRNHKYHGRTLECIRCRAESTTREKTLHAKFKKSKQYCKCGNPIHSEKCPLATMFYDKRRWPGGDGYLTAEDSVFLSNLHPRPQWWAHALRKPMKPK